MVKNCIKIFCVGLVLTCWQERAWSTDAKGKHWIAGPGLSSCGTYITDGKRVREMYDGWILGYLTGYNYWNSAGVVNILEGTDNQGALSWVNKYCKQHPTDTVDIASQALIDFMLHKK